MTIPNHQQNGQHWGTAKGVQEHHKPDPVEIVVRSVSHTWLGYLDVTTRSCDSASSADSGGDTGFSFRIRPTVVTPKCRPARASVSAIFTLPMLGHNVFSR